ncbi:hypothetical protein [Nocardioides baekrokdamisoli]|uniref:hypothetical protein n=1 Tax=Nocardioides baekrokdamisoli TaxID=1804624 RepID=UPI000F768764|nr:hypothetical protein [Nocardioides baekrokdamisoli]
MKKLIYALIAVVSFSTAFGVSVAFGESLGNTQQAYVNSNFFYDADVNIDARSLNPGDHQCILYSTLVTDPGAHKQVEAGLAGCTAWTIDGTCHDGHMFVEVSPDPNTYNCTQGAAFSTWTNYNTWVGHVVSTQQIQAGTADGTWLQTGVSSSDYLQDLTWVEDEGVAACPGAGNNANFNSWEYLGQDKQEHWATNLGNPVHAGYGPCWQISALSGTGAFNATR